jgi:outer membrane protein OmpA-like peptidoglycan-associated protein
MRVWPKFLMLASGWLALTGTATAGVVGNGLQNFNATPDGLDFVTINSSETLKPGIINLGLFFNFAVNPLPYVGSSPQGRLDFNDSVLGMDLNIAVGILPGWEVGLSAPHILGQTISDTEQTHGEFQKIGSTEIRPSTKVRLLGDDSGGLAIVGSIGFNRTINNPFMGVDPGPTYNLELAWDTQIHSINLGVNAGYRFAHPGSPVPGAPVSPIGDQITAGAAASYLIPHTDTKVICELFGAIPSSHVNSTLDRSSTSFEFLAGVKHDWTHNIAMHAGAGTGIGNGISSPDWRIYTGLNFSFGPVFSKTPAFSRHPEEEKFVIHNVVFEFDSDEMTGEYAAVLAEVSAALAKVGNYSKLVIEGHTDSIGNASYNMDLSQKRARKIREYLISVHGLDASKIEARGMGATVPVADNGNFQGRQENRRVEIHIVK